MAGVGNYEIIEDTQLLSDSSNKITIEAPTGKRVFFGHADAHVGGSAISFQDSYPNADGSGWTFEYSVGSQGKTVTFRVICAEMGDCE